MFKLEDRMKRYEGLAERALMLHLPVLARLDGRSFSAFTKHAAKPFSTDFRAHMINVAQYLLEEAGATVAFTASDEVTLAWPSHELVMFAGRVQKLASTLAAIASAKFNHGASLQSSEDRLHSGLAWHKLPTFDCRVWNVPTLEEACNVFVWRQADALRNSVQMAARAHYSHKECTGKSNSELQEMLRTRGVNWDNYASDFKRGTFLRRVIIERRFTAEELAELPEKHDAHKNPSMVFTRQVTRRDDIVMDRLVDKKLVLFKGYVSSYEDAWKP